MTEKGPYVVAAANCCNCPRRIEQWYPSGQWLHLDGEASCRPRSPLAMPDPATIEPAEKDRP